LWLTSRLTLPLKRLIPSIKKISQGDFRIHIPVTSADEYGQVTEALNQMARQLERTEEVRKQLTADVTHELRTPLAVIQSQLENIQSGGRAVSPETLLPIQDEVIRLTKLIEDLHRLTLAESGNLPLDRQPTDLVPLLDRIMDMFQLDAEEREIRITRKCAAENLVANIDPNRMTQAFYNLVSNALRYTPPAGQVVCEIARIEHNGVDYASVSVADTGIGIPEDKLPYLFERFYRVEEARSRDSGGMGLGLAIAKGFVEAHRGSIAVRSKIGEGTTFTVLLPIS
jgi:two-component system sensor histidine kinase BaeS